MFGKLDDCSSGRCRTSLLLRPTGGVPTKRSENYLQSAPEVDRTSTSGSLGGRRAGGGGKKRRKKPKKDDKINFLQRTEEWKRINGSKGC